jgi:hypothetical protein
LDFLIETDITIPSNKTIWESLNMKIYENANNILPYTEKGLALIINTSTNEYVLFAGKLRADTESYHNVVNSSIKSALISFNCVIVQ